MSERNVVEPFFIAGAPASGTTWLRAMVTSHSKLAIPPEFFILPQLVARYGLEIRSKKEVDKMARLIIKHRSFKSLSLDPGVVLERLVGRELTVAQVHDVLLKLWAEQAGAKYWGEKVPRTIIFLDAVQQAYPEARVIHVMRDPRAVIASQKRRWRTPLALATAIWSVYVGAGREHGRRHRDRYLEVRYEDLVYETEATLRRVCDFIGVDFEPGMLGFDPAVAVPDAPQVTGGVDRKALSRWREYLTDKQVGWIDWFLLPLMRKVGYEAVGVTTGRAEGLAEASRRMARICLRPGSLKLRIGLWWVLGALSRTRSGKIA